MGNTIINVPFTKVWCNNVDFELGQISSYILGKSNSVFYDFCEKENQKKFCGFYLPPFQRPEVWTTEQKIKLIESIFCEISIGSFIFVSSMNAPEVDGWLIDGQQRLTAIRDFIQGEFSVFDNRLSFDNMNEVKLSFNGDYRLNAPKEARFVWKRTFINCKRIEDVSDPVILKEIYDRFNYGGTPHIKKENN